MTTELHQDFLEQLSLILPQSYKKYSNNNIMWECGVCYAYTSALMHSHQLDNKVILIMMLTGCRISEVNNIKVERYGKGKHIQIYCDKQKLVRHIITPENHILNELLPLVHHGAHVIVDEKEITRSIQKNYKELLPSPAFKGHRGCHIMRYIHVAGLYYGLSVNEMDIMHWLGWSDPKLVNTYLEYINERIEYKGLTPQGTFQDWAN